MPHFILIVNFSFLRFKLYTCVCMDQMLNFLDKCVWMILFFFHSNVDITVFLEWHLFILIIFFLGYAKASHHKWRRKNKMCLVKFKDWRQLFFHCGSYTNLLMITDFPCLIHSGAVAWDLQELSWLAAVKDAAFMVCRIRKNIWKKK